MKKLFTLVVAAFAAVTVFAQTKDIGEPANNIIDEKTHQVFYNPETKVITFYKQWDYRPGWWLAYNSSDAANTGQDFSDYDELVVELDNPNNVKIQVAVKYVGDKDGSSAQGNGDKIVVPLNKNLAKHFEQIMLQCADAITDPVTATFKKAYFNATLQGDVAVLYEGEQSFTNWKKSVTLAKEKFANVKVGDKLRFTVETCDADKDLNWNPDWGSQLYIKSLRSGWNSIIDGSLGFKAAGELLLTIADDELDIPESQGASTTVKTSMLKELQEYGMVIQGAAAKLTKVEWIKVDTPTGISNATVAPATQDAKIYNLAGQQVDASYKGVVIKNGKKYVQ